MCRLTNKTFSAVMLCNLLVLLFAVPTFSQSGGGRALSQAQILVPEDQSTRR